MAEVSVERGRVQMPWSAFRAFLRCARCFYLNEAMGQPVPDDGSELANSLIELLGRAFRDPSSLGGLPGHLIPFDHPAMGDWRDAALGIRMHHPATDLELSSSVGELWASEETGDVHIVVLALEVPSAGTPLRQSLEQKRLDFLRYLLLNEGLPVAETAYIVHGAMAPLAEGARQVGFSGTVTAHETGISWIEEELRSARQCLDSAMPPGRQSTCPRCAWAKQDAVAEERMRDEVFRLWEALDAAD